MILISGLPMKLNRRCAESKFCLTTLGIAVRQGIWETTVELLTKKQLLTTAENIGSSPNSTKPNVVGSANRQVMKMQEALQIIEAKESGFMISFEKREGGLLKGDYFPDKHDNEELIATEDEAWEMAEKFAKATDDTYVNIYVINHHFSPVKGYDKKAFKRY